MAGGSRRMGTRCRKMRMSILTVSDVHSQCRAVEPIGIQRRVPKLTLSALRLQCFSADAGT
eukprot:354470-Chlamydomonas_euryale.AAC.20